MVRHVSHTLLPPRPPSLPPPPLPLPPLLQRSRPYVNVLAYACSFDVVVLVAVIRSDSDPIRFLDSIRFDPIFRSDRRVLPHNESVPRPALFGCCCVASLASPMLGFRTLPADPGRGARGKGRHASSQRDHDRRDEGGRESHSETAKSLAHSLTHSGGRGGWWLCVFVE